MTCCAWQGALCVLEERNPVSDGVSATLHGLVDGLRDVSVCTLKELIVDVQVGR
jgi:hypothetical protein